MKIQTEMDVPTTPPKPPRMPTATRSQEQAWDKSPSEPPEGTHPPMPGSQTPGLQHCETVSVCCF